MFRLARAACVRCHANLQNAASFSISARIDIPQTNSLLLRLKPEVERVCATQIPVNRSIYNFQQVALMSFFKAPDSDSLWKTMQGVSQQGKKRGRARNILRRKNLNRGQRLGFGKAKMDFPGLTSKITEGTGQQEAKKSVKPLGEKKYEDYLNELAEIQQAAGRRFGRRALPPMERGWTGGKPLGRRYGAPTSTNKELSFDGFDSVLLEFKTVFHMTGNMGRVRRLSILMVTGNRNGSVGFTVSSGKYGKNAASFKRAVNKAGLRLVTVPRYEDRTVYHDFFTQFGYTRIFVRQMPPGSGIRAHRSIKAICELAGIKDLHAKVLGSLNIQNITKAFILGLLRQRTHQDLADEKRLHLVEMRPESDYFPRVLASPSDGHVRTKAEIGHNEILDFEMISYEGHMPYTPRVDRNPWEGTGGWDLHLRRTWATNTHAAVREAMRIENGEQYGAVRSFLWPKYPECAESDKKKFLQERAASKNEE